MPPATRRPRRRRPRVLPTGLAAGLGTLAVLAGCARSEIRPAEPGARPEPVPVAVAEAGAPATPGPWTVLRVGGEPAAVLTVTPGVTKAGDPAAYYAAGTARLSAALPEGWPPPTAPGAVELKRFPATRQAVVETARGEGAAFWPLFRHISRRGIAMTAPVVMTGEMAGERDGGSSMAFLYRTRELGPTGPAEPGVRVEDAAEETVLAVGFRGERGRERLLDMQAVLQAWLDGQPEGGRWMRAGGPRLLGYNGPDAPRPRRWWELHVPVRWTPPPAPPASPPSSGPAADPPETADPGPLPPADG